MISKVKIYGERCSGTNYLEILISKNFKVQIINQYGFKHFFGFHNLKNTNDTLFICIIRDYYSWINSFYEKKWHLSPSQRLNKYNFLHTEHWSYFDDKRFHGENYGKEIIEDRNIFTKKRYKNLLELRYTKIKWMRETLPTLVKNTICIRYEDLLQNFEYIMINLYLRGLPLLSPSTFPENHTEYKHSKRKYNPKKYYRIKKEEIENHTFFEKNIEKELLYYIEKW